MLSVKVVVHLKIEKLLSCSCRLSLLLSLIGHYVSCELQTHRPAFTFLRYMSFCYTYKNSCGALLLERWNFCCMNECMRVCTHTYSRLNTHTVIIIRVWNDSLNFMKCVRNAAVSFILKKWAQEVASLSFVALWKGQQNRKGDVRKLRPVRPTWQLYL